MELDDNPAPLCNHYESILPSTNFDWLQLPCTGIASSIRITNNEEEFSLEEIEIYGINASTPDIFYVEDNVPGKVQITSHIYINF